MAAAQAGALTGVRVEAAVVDIFTSIKPSPLLPRPREKETVTPRSNTLDAPLMKTPQFSPTPNTRLILMGDRIRTGTCCHPRVAAARYRRISTMGNCVTFVIFPAAAGSAAPPRAGGHTQG